MLKIVEVLRGILNEQEHIGKTKVSICAMNMLSVAIKKKKKNNDIFMFVGDVGEGLLGVCWVWCVWVWGCVCVVIM